MQTIGPYRLVQALGTCPVGGVWSAVDTGNNQATVAVLTTAAAHDPGWRRAFAATANAMAQSGQVPIVAGDYSGAIPWVASTARDGTVLAQVFVALGLDYQPVPSPGDASGAEPVTRIIPTGPTSGGPTSGGPSSGGPISSVPTSGGRASAGPAHAAASPAARPSGPQPWEPPRGAAATPAPESRPMRSPQTVSPFSVPPAEPPPRRRTGLLVGVMVLVVVLLVGGGLIAVVAWPDDSEPAGQGPGESTVEEPTFPPPTAPGVEPPADGEWPADWPLFGDDEPVNQMVGMIGELDGQAFQVPDGWECPSVAAEGTFAHYNCGPDGDPAEIGGDLIIRFCADPCDESRRDEMRTQVEAWGLQWVRDFGFRSWAQTEEIDGEQRYGLVVVAYYRTAPEGRVDRQLVLRMTGPVEQADEIRKIANSVREAMT